jgi:hypothetical protein
MKNLKKFHKALIQESGEYEIKEAADKELAKEDSLSLVSEFVKDVKKKFDNKKDVLEILKDASKVLEFYINEIENSSDIDIMAPVSTDVLTFDDIAPARRDGPSMPPRPFGGEE